MSIHTPDGPLPEHSIQKQSRFSRISCYIPVPPAKVPPHSTTNEAEQSTFAISITLLTPGLVVPYSLPKPTPENPHPRPRIVGDIPSHGSEHGGIDSVIAPYMSISASVHETVAAYIYFDGRVKEEVATLLRKGEETWVNSRWVSVEGGGLAEREFLFREVGLENWLNGLDLEGDDTAAKIERRRQKMERKRQAKRQREADVRVIFDKDGNIGVSIRPPRADEQSPQESMSDNDDMISSGSESDDDDPIPEAAGQIKVALYRVLASGEVKKGEYSPQFGAHDDDDESMRDADKGTKPNRSMAGQAEVDHTTSFAEPKSLDPTCISTQTVTSIDPPEKPYAVFTFLYRGERK